VVAPHSGGPMLVAQVGGGPQMITKTEKNNYVWHYNTGTGLGQIDLPNGMRIALTESGAADFEAATEVERQHVASMHAQAQDDLRRRKAGR